MAATCYIQRAHSPSHGWFRDTKHKREILYHTTEFRTQKGRPCTAMNSKEGRTDLHHGLLVLAVLHLRCGQVNDAPLHRVFVAVIDEDVRATDHDEMFSPVAG